MSGLIFQKVNHPYMANMLNQMYPHNTGWQICLFKVMLEAFTLLGSTYGVRKWLEKCEPLFNNQTRYCTIDMTIC
jgi:hypothetical protein